MSRYGGATRDQVADYLLKKGKTGFGALFISGGRAIVSLSDDREHDIVEFEFIEKSDCGETDAAQDPVLCLVG
jgi:hypothetical protein